jgi:amidophosphoribosyltransferase
MSEDIKHECGIALIRLLKPLEFYQEKYGTSLYGLNKLYLLMEKQHNRGQDGAGIAGIKFDVKPGNKYISIEKSCKPNPIKDIFRRVHKDIFKACRKDLIQKPDVKWLKNNTRFSGELFLGHLRYGTYGTNSVDACHPFLRENNWMSRCLVLAGNFNLTNVDELFDLLLEIGQHPKLKSDTVTVLEKIGHFIDEENDLLVKKYKAEGYSKREISALIAKNIDIQKILKEACRKWDGGYVISGLLGHGDAFVLRDPAGIRPAFYYSDDEIVVVTSERPVIQTAFNVPLDSIKELTPGNALIIKKDGKHFEKPFIEPLPKKPCSFERIYFSRGTDADIYSERKALGRYLTPAVLKQVNHDLGNTVFSFIPNTAETCYLGMLEELQRYCRDNQKKQILKLGQDMTDEQLEKIMSVAPRTEKIAVKDAKLRTFITEDSERNDLVAHVYDITYNSIRAGVDSLVVIDDSIVRGTTLKESILRILDRLGPKKIVLVSSAPQIRYPDCYGIDMAKLGDFVAFRAAVELLKENNLTYIIDDIYNRIKSSDLKSENFVKAIYKPFTAEQVSEKIAELLKPVDIKAEIKIIYQKIETLHRACPNHKGDWYFTGDYPTPGGNKVVNRSFINFVEGINDRAY